MGLSLAAGMAPDAVGPEQVTGELRPGEAAGAAAAQAEAAAAGPGLPLGGAGPAGVRPPAVKPEPSPAAAPGPASIPAAAQLSEQSSGEVAGLGAASSGAAAAGTGGLRAAGGAPDRGRDPGASQPTQLRHLGTHGAGKAGRYGGVGRGGSHTSVWCAHACSARAGVRGRTHCGFCPCPTPQPPRPSQASGSALTCRRAQLVRRSPAVAAVLLVRGATAGCASAAALWRRPSRTRSGAQPTWQLRSSSRARASSPSRGLGSPRLQPHSRGPHALPHVRPHRHCLPPRTSSRPAPPPRRPARRRRRRRAARDSWCSRGCRTRGWARPRARPLAARKARRRGCHGWVGRGAGRADAMLGCLPSQATLCIAARRCMRA